MSLRRNLLSSLIIIFSYCFAVAQCPTAADVDCDMTAGQFDNVVIGEVSGDSGQSDGTNDAIVEIIGPPGTPIGCMVITDTEWAVLIPPNTVIPPDGVYAIGCLNGPGIDSGDNGGVGLGGSYMAPGSPNGLEAGGNGDWNPGVPIDLDVCAAGNFQYYDPAASGFTLDNAGTQSANGDGEQVFLFLPDGTPHDGILWDGGGTGGPDHTSISSGNPYTLGDNDGNGVVNDVITTVLGGRGDGGNSTAVPFLPTNDGCPCNTPAAPGTFTVPPYTAGDPTDLWVEWTTSDHVGCNSSFIRLASGTTAGGFGGSPSHTDGEIEDATMDGMGQNLDNGSGAGLPTDFGENMITSEVFDPNSFTPSSCGEADATSEWAYTDHPTPGQPNDDPTFIFYADETVFCQEGEITITAEIYNWQHVEDQVNSTNQGAGKFGSYIVDETGTVVPWTTYNPPSGETTILEFTSGTLPPGVHIFEAVWDDWTDCCGSSTGSTSNECYESNLFTITVLEPLAYDCDGDGVADDPQMACAISCPGDSPQGTVNVSNFVTGGADLTYELFNAPAGTAGTGLASNATGVFSIPTSMTDGPYEVRITNGEACIVSELIISIADDCELPPVCPENLDISASTGDGAFCPGEMVELCLDGDNLPAGGTICWYATTDGTDPISEDAAAATATIGATAMQIGCVNIPAAPSSIPVNTTPVINEVLFDGLSGCDGGSSASEFIEIAGVPGTNVGCYILTDGDWEVVLPPGTVIPSDGFLLVGNSEGLADCAGGVPAWATDIDVDIASCMCDSGQATNLTLTNGAEFVYLFDPTGVFTDGVVWGNPTGTNSPSGNGSETVAASTAGCTPPGSVNTNNPPTNTINPVNQMDGESIGLIVDGDSSSGLDEMTQIQTGNSIVTPGAPNAAPMAADPTCLIYEIPAICDMSPATITIEPLIEPIDPNCVDGDFNYVGDQSAFTVDCPSAVLDATPIDICESDMSTTEVPITITGGVGPFTVVYSINGGADMILAGANSGDGIPITGPTNGEIKVTLVSITDEGGATCSGSVDGTEVCVNIRPTETLTITGSSNPSTCAPDCDGTITFDYSVPGAPLAVYDIEYSFNGTLFQLSGVGMPFTITNACPGDYDIVNVLDDAGCVMDVESSPQTLDPVGGDPVMVTGGPGVVCNDGSEMVDLENDFSYTPAFVAADFTFFTADPNTLPPAALAAAQLTMTTFAVTSNQTIWVQYTDPVSGCMSIATLNIEVDPTLCFACPTIGALTVTGDVCDDNDFTLAVDGLDDALMMQTGGGGPFQIQFVYYIGAGAAPANPYTTPGTALGSPVSSTAGSASLITMNTGLPAGDLTIVAILTPTPTDPTCIPFASVEVENLVCEANAGRF